jgi:hypothetical protein
MPRRLRSRARNVDMAAPLLVGTWIPSARSVSPLCVAVLIGDLCLVFMEAERHRRRGVHHG